jgi:magnesium-transporting ATPase (P-type)
MNYRKRTAFLPGGFTLAIFQPDHLVLIAAAVISGLRGEWVDTAPILAIVVLNGLLGSLQEYRAEQALAALQKLSLTYAHVIREKTRHAVPSRDLVPGDVSRAPALALAADPYAPDLMRRPPRHPAAPMFDAAGMWTIIWQGLLLSLVTMAAFLIDLYGSGRGVRHAGTMASSTLVLAQLFHSFSCRSERYSLFRIGVATNRPLIAAVVFSALLQVGIVISPWGQEIFKVELLKVQEWLLNVGWGLFPWLAMDLWKFVRYRPHDGSSASRSV